MFTSRALSRTMFDVDGSPDPYNVATVDVNPVDTVNGTVAFTVCQNQARAAVRAIKQASYPPKGTDIVVRPKHDLDVFVYRMSAADQLRMVQSAIYALESFGPTAFSPTDKHR